MFTGTLPAVTDCEHWTFLLELIDPTTNGPFDLTGVQAVQIAVKRIGALSPELTGSIADGKITIVGPATDGTVRVRFEPTDMARFAPDTYAVGIRITAMDGTKTSLLVGQVGIIDGVVEE